MRKVLNYIIICSILVCIFSQTGVSEAYNSDNLEMSSAIRLKELGILQGSGQGFELDNKMTRLEGLIVIIRLLGKEEYTNDYADIGCKFSDVPEWGVKYVNYAVINNLTKGISDNAFGSQQLISGKQFITFLLRVLGYDEATGDFSFDTAIDKSISLGIIDKSESTDYSVSELTRGMAAILSCRALDTKIKAGNETLSASLEYLNSDSKINGVSVTDFGARGDGQTDDTSAIQRAIDQCDNVYIPDGVYMINGSIGLKPKSDQVIKLSNNAVMKIIPNKSSSYSMFYFSNISNTIIEGGTIIGDRYDHTDINGESGTGVYIASNNNSITIKNMKIKEFLGDGIDLGEGIVSQNIYIQSVICSDNRGNGLLIRNSSDVVIKDSLFEESNGSGSAGIILGDKAGNEVNNVTISNTMSLNNAGSGILIDGEGGKISGVKIENCGLSNNGSGMYLNTCKNITVINTKISNNLSNGLEFVRDVTCAEFSDMSCIGNGSRGVSLVVTQQQDETSGISFNNCIFSDNSNKDPGKYDGIRIDNYDSSKMLEHISFSSCRFIDDQEAPTQRYGLTVGDSAGISDIVVDTNCKFKGNIIKDMVTNDFVTMQVPAGTGDCLNIKDAGAAGDGVTDDTAAIQRALKASDNIFVPEGVYLIDTKVGIKVNSNQNIVFEGGATFKAIPNSNDFYMILNISNVENVTITGGIFIGDRYDHLSKSGEWGTGAYITSDSQNINIKNSKFENFWGDGIYIGGDTPPENINIDNVVCDNNLRSGISITNAMNITISNSEFCNSNGKDPQTGINIEPNSTQACENITICGVKCLNNSGNGIDLLGNNGSIKSISISDTTSYKNADGIYMESCDSITIESSTITKNRNYGLNFARDIVNGNFSNLVISKNNSVGAALITSSQAKGLINLVFNGCTFSNNGSLSPNSMDGVRIDLYDFTGIISNVRFYSCRFIDDQTSRTQRYGISINETQKVSNIYIDSKCFFNGNIKGNVKYG